MTYKRYCQSCILLVPYIIYDFNTCNRLYVKNILLLLGANHEFFRACKIIEIFLSSSETANSGANSFSVVLHETATYVFGEAW